MTIFGSIHWVKPLSVARVGKVNKLSTFQLLPQDAAFVDAAPEAVVVLIDEIDKAPRDTPNDLLSEIEELSFSIPELGVRVTASPHYRPITILTSNEERALPGPFLRRCAFFNIPFPNTETLRAIVSQTLGIDAKGAMLESALDFVKGVRQNQNISKKPGTSEILAWLDVLRRQPNFDARRSLST